MAFPSSDKTKKTTHKKCMLFFAFNATCHDTGFRVLPDSHVGCGFFILTIFQCHTTSPDNFSKIASKIHFVSRIFQFDKFLG